MEKPTLQRSLFHASLSIPACLAVGWGARAAFDFNYGALSFILLALPVAVAFTRNHRKALFLATALIFSSLALANPLWEKTPWVMPNFGPEIAPLSVNGVTPRSFLNDPSNCALQNGKVQKLTSYEAVVLKSTDEYSRVRLALKAGLVVDSRFRMFGDSKLKTGIKFGDLTFRDGDFLGKSVEQVEISLGRFYRPGSFERIPCQAWLNDSENRDLAVYHDQFLAVFGTEIYQGKNLRIKLNQELEDSLRGRFDFSNDFAHSKLAFTDTSFQKSNRNNGKVYLHMENRTMKDVWSQYPLPVEFRSGPETRSELEVYSQPENPGAKSPVLRERKGENPSSQPDQ